MCLEHQLDAGALIQGSRQTEQAPGERNDLQFAQGTATVVGSKYGVMSASGTRAVALTGVKLGEGSHCQAEYVTRSRGVGDYGRTCTWRKRSCTGLGLSI